ncbi:v-type ATPase subunit family domain-containing protein [Ditylenchus destructor]|uniref:V-type proton ATPase subunit a n=1 Tax=Ditylenchus destructor TaxID=166010 RepID=A0AAD4N970_9BILA|nr:v-type ATPase subunit family domain-containing protein [Ditylenchus destructor]
MIVQKDAAYACVVELGQKFDLGYIEKEVIDGGARDHIPPLDVTKTEVSLQREMWDLETRLYDLERDVRQFLQNEAQLKRNVNDLKQCKSVYEKVEAFFKVHIENTARTELDNDGEEINDVHSFERVLWRACRRTAFVRTAEIDSEAFEDPDRPGKMINKSVFIIFFNGRKLQDIVNRVCDGFNAKQYSCPKTSKERQLALADILIGIHDLNLVIRTTEKHKLEETAGGTVRPIMNVIETGEVRPTYNRTNKFIQVFQNIVDSYGIASYREINPAPFTIITFPFLFAVMFGDLGHGIILLLAGLSFILYEKKVQEMRIKDEIFNTFFGGRFIIVLMGLFSIYAGFMYNDAFSKSFNVFGSKWRSYFKCSVPDPNYIACDILGSDCAPSLLIGLINMFMFRKRRKGFINPETNEAYMNCHLSQWYPYQAKTEATLVIIALLCIPVMLLGKPLCKVFSKPDQLPISRKISSRKLNKSKNINVRITVDSEDVELIGADLAGDVEHNGTTQAKGDKKKSRRSREGAKANAGEAEMKMVDFVVHQAIHTIEFVLGCVSHTASYLRLWALSLAHAQLSEVLWHMVLAPSFSFTGPLAPLWLFIMSFVFFVMTVSILVLMEGLSAFLHALRLHWVEFQSKFYEGGGFPFVAFSLKNSLKKLCEESDVY